MISLARGVPSPDLLPAEPLAEAAARAIARHGRTALNYGEPAGFVPLRERIGAEHGVGPDSVLVTPGSLIALNLLIRRLAGRSARVVVEAPSYDRTLGVLASAGADVVSVAHDDRGLDLDALADLLTARPRPAFLYVLPTFHNPTGRTLSREQREQLADLAVAHDLLVVEDDPYGLLRIEGEPEPSLFALLHERGGGHLAVRLSSFSKSVAPGLRVGYVVAPPPLAASVAADIVPLYLSPPLLAQAQLFEFLDGGMLEPHLEWLRPRLRERRDALLDVFERPPAGAGHVDAPGRRLLRLARAAAAAGRRGDPRAGERGRRRLRAGRRVPCRRDGAAWCAAVVQLPPARRAARGRRAARDRRDRGAQLTS